MNEPGPKRTDNDLPEQIGRKARRKIEARSRKNGVWFGLGMFGLVGWSVSIPTIGGIALGLWIDKHYPGPASWTLTLLLAGLILGCLNAWRWIKKESRGE